MGSGGMADVFRAASVGSQGFRRVVVIKRVQSALAGSPEMLGLFRDEARISALLNHPNIVQVHDFGRVDGTPFLAMEYVQGRDLRAVLRALTDTRRRMQPATAALIGRQVAQALHYAHTLRDIDNQHFRIVHRDINPDEPDAGAVGDGEGPRLRRRQGVRARGQAADGPARDQGQAQLPVARAGAVSPGGRAVGRVLAGRDAVGDAGGAAAVRGRDGVRAHPRRAGGAHRAAVDDGAGHLADAGRRRHARAGARRRASAIRPRRRWPRTWIAAWWCRPPAIAPSRTCWSSCSARRIRRARERLPLASKSGGRDSVSASRKTPGPTTRSGSKRLRPPSRTVSLAWAVAMTGDRHRVRGRDGVAHFVRVSFWSRECCRRGGGRGRRGGDRDRVRAAGRAWCGGAAGGWARRR